MSSRRGFTLLEVMVAMAILALGLTTILSSQTGLFASTRRVQNETHAASLMRCKMTEVELQLLKDGYPLLEQNESGECCEEEDANGFRCEWLVQTVELPQPSSFEGEAEGESEGDAEGDAEGEVSSPLGTTAGDLAAASPLGAGFSDVSGVEDLAGTLGESAEGGGIIGMALQMVYPTLKPMLEASIRKITVKVLWDEGDKERTFEVTQYVTNPMEGDLNPNAAENFEAAIGGLLEGSGLDGSTGTDAAAAPDAEAGAPK